MTEHLLEVQHLSVEFHTIAGQVKAVDNVSWYLDRGEVLAILGESGSGKSVSAAAVMDLIETPPGKISSGKILFDGHDLLQMPAAQRRAINGKRIAMIFQDPLSHLNPVYTAGWQIAETLIIHGTAHQQARLQTLELLERVGIPEPVTSAEKYPHQFSGGQRQRLMIAMALALRPDILIADEPTTALDVTVQAQILQLLQNLQRETGMGLLLITHDLGVVAEVAGRVVIMNSGKIVEQGLTLDVYRNPSHPYTRDLIAAAPGKGELSPNLTRPSTPLLQVTNLSKSFGQFDAVTDVSFDMMKGECIAIVGESGSGKSTLAKALLRLDEPDAGQAIYNGRDLFSLGPEELFAIRRDIQMVFQDPTQSLNPRMSVFELICEAWIIHKEILAKSQWPNRVHELLSQVGLSPEHAGRYPHQFSGGQRQRIAIARALALEPAIIICDEAVSALDVQVQAQVIDLLTRLQKELQLSYLFIAHDLPVVRDFADRVIVMQGGRIVEQGGVAAIFENPTQAYTRNLLASSLDPDPEIQATRRGRQLQN
ncbi:ABC transporter ATP-binding protein [Chromatiales bacterium (ex Bugula neritina AB1)]|nr:ABC transporter ATP-binding protein [Chromatiales bacterium (ex Bugula neritina AB1)]